MKKIKLSLITFLISGSLLSYSLKTLGEGAAAEVGKEVVGGAVTSAATGAAVNAAVGGTGLVQTIRTKLASPIGVGVMSGISMAMNMVLYNAASEQAAESENNSKKIEKMIAVYKSTFQDYCPNGRDNLKEPRCYCYSDDGSQNTNRSNSQTCQDLWSKDNTVLDGTKTNYVLKANTGDLYGCMTVNNQYDEDCKCKKLVNSSGENACLKSSQLSISMPGSLANYAKANGLQNVMALANNTANGNGDLSGLSSGALAINGLNSRNKAIEILSDQVKKSKNPDLAKSLEMTTDLVKAFQTADNTLGKEKLLASNSPGSPYSASDVSGKLGDAIKNVEKDLKNKGIELVGGAGRAKATQNKPGLKFNFDSASSGNSNQILNLPESQSEKKYKIKGDINTNDSASIWEMISNRYLQSGLKRLMDE